MIAAQFIAARFDGEVVVLDVARAALVLLDAQSTKVLEACEGRTFSELRAAVGGSRLRLIRALRNLHSAGLISREPAGWVRVPVRDA
ncbi:MAG TPA: hypothetical protein VFM39_06155 [bacterium]|nr:hypothetical protein [bacterium]